MMTDLELRVPHGVGSRLRAIIDGEIDGYEAVAIGFISLSMGARAVILRDIAPLPQNAYVSGASGTTWRHSETISAVRTAAARGCGLVLLHAHVHRGMPRPSSTDITNYRLLAGGVAVLFPSVPFGSMVVSIDGYVAGLIMVAGHEHRVGRARWLGASIVKLPAPQPFARERAKRHNAVWSDVGEGALRAARLGFIGMGSGGAHELQQLAHAGVGTIVGVDDDRTDLCNRSRTVGTRPGDVGRKKLWPMKRLVRDAGDDAAFVAVDAKFPSRAAIAALVSCDLLMASVDTLHARKNVMEFAWQHAIPLIDIGLTIVPMDPGPGVAAIGGHVFVGVPGGRCMWCEGILSKARLEAELDEQGYVRGGGNAQVVSMNGSLASQAVTEALNLLTGFWKCDELPPARLIYDGRSLRSVVGPPRPCELCPRLGFGDVTWPDSSRASPLELAQPEGRQDAWPL